MHDNLKGKSISNERYDPEAFYFFEG